MSAALVSDLRAVRHQVFQAHLASDFAVAFDLMLFTMCEIAFQEFGYERKPIDMSITPAQTHNSAEHRAGTVADSILAALKANLRLDWRSLPKPQRFPAMCALTMVEKQALFAYAAAHGVQQQLSTDSDAIPAIEIAGARMKVAVAQNWRPTASNYFGRVKKDMLLQTARETIDDQWAHDHGGGKKADLARSMELAFGSEGRQRVGIPADVAARAAAWLPAGMAFGAASDDAPSTTMPPIANEDGSEPLGGSDTESEGDVVVPAFLMALGAGEDGDEDPIADHLAVAAE